LDHNHNLLKPDDCNGIESDLYPKAIPNTKNKGFFQNPKETEGNENRDKLE
jgi:hypothetical protein